MRPLVAVLLFIGLLIIVDFILTGGQTVLAIAEWIELTVGLRSY